jgi:TonB family protein
MAPRSRVGAALLAALAGALMDPARAQSPLAIVQDFSAGAEYERCLAALDSDAITPDDTVRASEYRALCLMGLNRERDAPSAVENLLHLEPLYRAGPNTPPRYRTLVQTVKHALVKSLVQERYAAARKDYDAQLYPAAKEGFNTVIQLIDEATGSEDIGSLADLKTVAAGFLDLIAAHAAAPPATPAPAQPPAPAPGPQDALPAARGAPAGTSTQGSSVTPPVPVQQELPPWHPTTVSSTGGVPFSGTLEVGIDARGAVTSARLLAPIHPEYDRRLLAAARKWTYKPAMKNGEPVAFTKVITIELQNR